MSQEIVHLPVHVNTEGGDDGIKSGVIALLARLDVRVDKTGITPLEGGITNGLLRCARDDSSEPPVTNTAVPASESTVLVRIFGKNTELLIDRDLDNRVFGFLGTTGLGPRLFATFENGRIEQLLDAKALEPEQMRLRAPIDVLAKIADCVAHFHSLSPPGVAQGPVLWTRLQGFFNLAREAYPCPERAAPRYEIHWEDIARELSWLQDVLPSERNGHGAALLGKTNDAATAARHVFRSVFCHNDLLSGNFLLDSDAALFKEGGVGSGSAAEVEAAALTAAARQKCAGHGAVGCGSCVTPVPAGVSPHSARAAAIAAAVPPAHADPRSAASRPRLVLIDYEYANTNYAAYDLANHLCEHAGFAFDLAADFPSPALRKSLLRLYVDACARHEGHSGHGSAGSAAPAGAGGASASWSEAQVEAMVEWVDRFLLASHFWWGLWALVQARHSPIDFDFEGYAIKRLRGYALHKAEFWPGVPSVRALFREL